MLDGSTWVSGVLSAGPPSTWMTFDRLMPYSSACRTCTFCSASLLFGETVLNTMYGFDEAVAPTFRFGSLLASSCGICDGGGHWSHSMSAVSVPVCSCC